VVTGTAFLLLAAILLLVAGYEVMLARSQTQAHLERRLAAHLRGTSLGTLPSPASTVPVPDILAPLLVRAQIVLTSRLLLAISGSLALAVLGALLAFGPFAALVAATALPGALLFYLRRRARRRTEQLVEDLPFFIDSVRQLIAVGNSLPQALARALPAASPAVHDYIGPAIRRIELGAPLAEALQQVAARLHVPEISMLASAVRVNVRYGGPLTQILSNIATLIRERSRVGREIAAATAEMRVSAKLLAVMPLILAAFFLLSNRAYLDFFLDEQRGRHLAMLAVSLQVVGAIAMARVQRLNF